MPANIGVDLGFSWIQESDRKTEIAGLPGRITIFENTSETARIKSMTLSSISDGSIYIMIQFSNNTLYNSLLHWGQIRPIRSSEDIFSHQYKFNRNDLSELNRFLNDMAGIEIFFLSVRNRILQLVEETYATPEQILESTISSFFQREQNNLAVQLQMLLPILQIFHYLNAIASFQTLFFLRQIFTNALPEKILRQQTFMGTTIRDIPTNLLIHLDDRYESAEEILAGMNANASTGKNIFLNPNSAQNNLFSESAIQILKVHSILKDFIIQYETKQARLSRIELPNGFYDALQTYLMEIYRIGEENSDPWNFMTPDGQEDYAKLRRCIDLRNRFLERIKTICDDEQQKALTLKTISAQLRGGSTADVKFDVVVKGEDSYECIITQQIFLWSLLRAKRPETIVPEKLRSHHQARFFDLGDIPVRNQSNIPINGLGLSRPRGEVIPAIPATIVTLFGIFHIVMRRVGTDTQEQGRGFRPGSDSDSD